MGGFHTSPQGLYSPSGCSAPHPGSPAGWVSAAVVPATWVGSQPSRGPSDLQRSGASLLPPRAGGWCWVGEVHTASSEPQSGAASSVPAVWQLRRQRVPAHPKGAGVWEQLGRAMGAGEPLKHEEPVGGPGGGRSSVGQWTWNTSRFPARRAEGNPRPLSAASWHLLPSQKASSQQHLQMVPSHHGWKRALLMGSLYSPASPVCAANITASESTILPKSPALRDCGVSLGKPSRAQPARELRSPCSLGLEGSQIVLEKQLELGKGQDMTHA